MRKIILLLYFVQGLLYSQTTPQQMVANMKTGINLGNILSAPYEGNWADVLTEDYIDNVARLNFKFVRIPIRFNNQTTPLSSVAYTDGNGNYIGSPANYTVSVNYLNRIEQIINWCTQRNLIAIIDVHGDFWFWESFDSSSPNYLTGNDRLAAIDRFKAIWRDISIKFQNAPDTVLFEIMNEPFFSMNATEVIDMNSQMLNIIRSTNPTRCVIVTGGGQNSFQAPMQLSDAFIQSDNYLIATFHYYKPFNFTSSASQNYTDNDWGTSADQQQVINEFDQLGTWSTQKNIPIFLGEFGADNVNGYDYFNQTDGLYGGPDLQSRFVYHQFVANYARTKGFALAVWDAGEKANKTIYLNSSKSWVKDVRNAVLGAICTSDVLFQNRNIEYNYDYNWNLSTTSNSIAKINNATKNDSYQNSNTLEINVTQSNSNFEDVILSNDVVTTGITSNQTFQVNCLAKSNNNQQFKFQIICMVNGLPVKLTSAAFQLNNTFMPFSYTFTTPINTSSVQVQVLCGNNLGKYFFDEFYSGFTLSVENFKSDNNNFTIFPIPFQNYFEIETTEKINAVELFEINGRKVNAYFEKGKCFTNVSKGVYILKITSENGVFYQKLINE